MYTCEDLKKSLAEVKEKIETIEITEEVFLECIYQTESKEIVR